MAILTFSHDKRPILLACAGALFAHAAMLPIQFVAPPKPQQEPSLDIQLVQQQATKASSDQTPGNRQQMLNDPPLPVATNNEPQESPELEPLTVARSENQHVIAKRTPPEPVPEPEPEPEQPPELDANTLRTASLQAVSQLLPQAQLAPETIRRKYISSNTEEWKYANYLRAWTDKVERVGNMNYPEEARKNRFSGDLIMSVGIRPDGSVESIEILRHSGFAVLDRAAVRIVELAAPYANIPDAIREEVDILYITRTWRFDPDSGLYN